MSSVTEIASLFFEACEAGKGWEVCKEYCKPNATFSAQAEPLADIKSLDQYADWMKAVQRCTGLARPSSAFSCWDRLPV